MRAPSLSAFRRIVVKVGSSLLVDRGSGLRRAWLEALAEDVAALHAAGRDVLIVSSGAIALGRTVLRLPPGALKLEEAQAAAAVGQIELARIWSEVLGHHHITAGQILLTYSDTEERRRYLNARETLAKLLEMNAVPIINENDTVATAEIRYGDNDRLAARVASMASADCLVLLSDIDGLFTAPPQDNPDARLVPIVPRISAAIEASAGGAASELSRGGMRTKIEAAKIAIAAGSHMVIANGKHDHALQRIADGGLCTWFLTPSNPVTSRKRWIGGTLEPKGALIIDDGAVEALKQGKSLLPAGIVSIEGNFSRGDAVLVRSRAGVELARGLIAYDTAQAAQLVGRKTGDIEKILGYQGRSAMIHRDDLVLIGDLS
ncbi:MAG: glutamate 5-kinase [Beijerinckiaceae bacterium]|nr:glutamate 5-kinase [Beijerinckiaceae bacterium]